MALIKLGPLVGQASGSQGATVFSRNRYGAYTRNRAIPVTSTSTEATAAKARLTAASSAWGALTSAQRLAWQTWAQNNPIINRLGDSQVLTGHAGYVQSNARIARCGAAAISAPPLGVAPSALATLAPTYDIGLGTFGIVFTATPLAANLRLWSYVAIVQSAGINYVENLLKLATVTAAAQASPYDDLSDIEARFGTLQVGDIVHHRVHVVSDLTGMISQPLRSIGTVIST